MADSKTKIVQLQAVKGPDGLDYLEIPAEVDLRTARIVMTVPASMTPEEIDAMEHSILRMPKTAVDLEKIPGLGVCDCGVHFLEDEKTVTEGCRRCERRAAIRKEDEEADALAGMNEYQARFFWEGLKELHRTPKISASDLFKKVTERQAATEQEPPKT